MSAMADLLLTNLDPQNQQERLELANQLYRLFRTRCFWHSPPDLVTTEELVPFVVKGLRTYGDRRVFILSGKSSPRIARSFKVQIENPWNTANAVLALPATK